ncbi:MAG TPA: zf-HC2 domain-containing protein [Symbiobacteriaceae bacterium]|nr:zf-HC2 domain-containing protein [Symbiobacteriaceae bacterium]
MDHLQPAQLQQFLAGELDLSESAGVEAHLIHCSQCEAVLAALAADDAALVEALALSPAEATWIETQDLRPAVAKRIAPWYQQPQGLLLLLPIFATAAWMVQATASVINLALSYTGPVGIGLALLEGLGRLTWRFLTYLASGGPLITLCLLGALTLWFHRRKQSHA